MMLPKIIRHPFALVGQGFLLGGLLFVALQDAPAANATPQAVAASER